jgi:ABC-2 type transport system ATP-binding protein
MTKSDQPAIVIDTVSRSFRSFWGRSFVTAVHRLSLTVPRGCVFGLLGPNGSGKTTTLSMLLGLLRPDSGSIHVLGAPAGAPEVRGRIGYLPEDFEPPDYLTGEEVLRFYGGLHGSGVAATSTNKNAAEPNRLSERIDYLLDALDMQGARKRKFREYSKGMRRRIGLAQALLHEPELVVLDEPTNGLDPLGVRRVRTLISDLRSRGCTVLLSSHILPEVEEICEQVAVLRDGESLCAGTTEVLLRRANQYEIELADSDEAAARGASKTLENEGHEIAEVRPARRSLESLFLELVEGQERGAGGDGDEPQG